MANISKSKCIVCCEGKQSRQPFAHEGNRSTELLGVVHCDICGPMKNVFLGGSDYFLIFVVENKEDSFVSIESVNDLYEELMRSEEESQSNFIIKTLLKRQKKELDKYGWMCIESIESLSDELTLEEVLQGPEKVYWE
ncbi:Retrovirus-related Pol polyprotein from transposon TNT 1-94 [Eumeta japonica]|uniref:Retrovirus-related Pol polyprotein from transposon TNT 1-94 n=1 Tax=Eumeta variegata TaxID=151549 RepID=A0A4C1XQC9_EUMVA|nr:Retrovirus-related Pol polyprotein from transposon TNT 1-94 [Eumeta japonica]